MCRMSLLLWPGFSCKFRALVSLCLPSLTRKMRNTLFPTCLLIAVLLYVRYAYRYVLTQTVEVEYLTIIHRSGGKFPPLSPTLR